MCLLARMANLPAITDDVFFLESTECVHVFTKNVRRTTVKSIKYNKHMF